MTSPGIPVEICIACDDLETTQSSVLAAFAAGASRIELCSEMALHGLTPAETHIAVAHRIFKERRGVLAMIRPRPGDFDYTRAEIAVMLRQIDMAHHAGADGVVLGALKHHRIDAIAVKSLVDLSKEKGLAVTFHRAFDAAADPIAALETCIELGVDRILSSGTSWQAGGTALDGLDNLREYLARAANRIEIVIAGGVCIGNAAALLRALPVKSAKMSLHSYSGVRLNGKTDSRLVSELVRKANSAPAANPD